MNTIQIQDVPFEAKIMSLPDTAMWLNLTHRKLVDELLEAFTDFTDQDIIEEIVDTLNLPLIQVVETSNKGLLIHGYINREVMT